MQALKRFPRALQCFYTSILFFVFGFWAANIIASFRNARMNEILNKPELFADHLKKTFMCHLPSDSACGNEQDYFRIFERKGVHVLPVHFYSIVPEVQKLEVTKFQRPKVDATSLALCEKDPLSRDCPIPELPGLDLNLRGQVDTIQSCMQFQKELAAVPSAPQMVDGTPEQHSRWVCSQHSPKDQVCPPYGAIDAQVYHCMIRQFKPKQVIEIGSGHSTYIAIAAMEEAGIGSKLTAIEPYPSPALISRKWNIQFELIEKNVQDVDTQLFRSLEANDILFIDSTHIAAPGSDVVHIFTHILPLLPPGVIVHFHDICLPFETAWDWTFLTYRFWNEQYMLHSFLLSNAEWEIMYMGALWEHYLGALLGKIFPLSGANGSFWMKKKMSLNIPAASKRASI